MRPSNSSDFWKRLGLGHVHLLKSRKKTSVLKELLTALAKTAKPGNLRTILKSLEEQEASSTTALGRGAALPHYRSDKIKGLHLIIGLSRTGIDWQAEDGIPVRMVFLVLAGKGRERDYLTLVADIANFVKRGNLALHEIDGMKNPDTFLERLKSFRPSGSPSSSPQLAAVLRYEHLLNQISALGAEERAGGKESQRLVESLRTELAETAAVLDRAVVERLQRLSQKYDGSISARLYNDACSFCFSHPSALELNTIRRGLLVHCSSCGKVLYIKDA